MSNELTILNFREYARQVLDIHCSKLNDYNKYHLLHSRFERLRFFNSHLKQLKDSLEEEMLVLLSNAPTANDNTELEKDLRSISVEYIDEYLSIGFGGAENNRI